MTARLLDRDPGIDRFDALTVTALQVMAGAAFGFLAAAALGWSRTVPGWAVVAVFTLPGLAPLVRWARRARSADTYYLGAAPEGWRSTLRSMAASSAELGRIAQGAVPGPIADHLHELHRASEATFITTYRVAVLSDGRAPVPPEVLDASRDVSRLTEAATQLEAAHHRNLHRPLADLIERTEVLTAVLDAPATEDLMDAVAPSPPGRPTTDH